MPVETMHPLPSNMMLSVQLLISLSEKAIYNRLNCQILAGHLKCLRTLCNDIDELNSTITEPAFKALEALDGVLNKARELVERCGPTTSKLYMALRSKQFKAMFESISIKASEALSALPLSYLQISEKTERQIEGCINELEEARYMNDDYFEQISLELEKILMEFRDGLQIDNKKLKEIAEDLELTLNQELLREASFLEREKEFARAGKDKQEEEYVNQLIGLVTQMGDYLIELKHSRTEAGAAIPADFRCPLSLELMSDPVIVASGQTYERSYIQQWLDEGMTTCPKTRQILNHKNLIPNYTVKALIANWCETNKVPLPEPAKPIPYKSSQKPNNEFDAAHVVKPVLSQAAAGNSSFPSQAILSQKDLSSGNVPRMESAMPFVDNSNGETSSLRSTLTNGKYPSQSVEKSTSNRFSDLDKGHSRNISISSNASSLDDGQVLTGGDMQGSEGNTAMSDCSPYSTDASGELNPPPAVTNPQFNEVGPSRMLFSGRLPNLLGRRTERNFPPLVISSSTSEPVSNESGIYKKVQKLVEDLQSDSVEIQRVAAGELRLLAKYNMENRIIIANCGATRQLVGLLSSPDVITQEIAVTALLNLSINDNNKNEIAAAGAIVPLINVLKVGSPEAKENAAATLFSLSVMEENKIAIGQAGAIQPLVDLLKNGTPRGKKDAATALFNLSILHENKARIVHAGAVKPLINLMEPAGGMVDKAVAVLSNLTTIKEGRTAIGEAGGIPVLVEVVEIGSQRGKENAAAALLHLCTNCSKYRAMVLQEGAIPPLVALSQTGTPRAKEKAQALLRHFRDQRHATIGRGGERHMDRHFS